ncbi:hypothetical protein IGI04_003616 [Brassica rapa subsp. trilocularis]|uniref:Zinc finger GRF-type domain-containing protein n=3 Tax=Brassica campestris TaxID=3711 RepID=A0ABQ7NYZ2_BRACM|nr:hypothetical protein IGI04_003616 [Brassica rapa subsp. trilocularis]
MEASSSHASGGEWLLLSASMRKKGGDTREPSTPSRFRRYFSIKSITFSLLHTLRSVLSRLTMDPAEERRHSKRQQDHINMLGFVSDSEYGIPKRCPCGGRIIDEVRRKDDYDTLPGKRFFTCKNYEADGFHYRQPWVIGVQEEIERLTKRVVEAEEVMLGSSNLCKLIDRLEDQVKMLSEQVDDLTVQVATLEKVCFE